MLNLINTDTISASASVDNVVNFTISGLIDSVFSLFNSGQVSITDPTVIYTASTDAIVTSIMLTNTHTTDVTVNLYVNASRVISDDMLLGVGDTLHFDGNRLSLINASGSILTLTPAGSTELSIGNITEDSVGITSDGSDDDVIIPAATNTVAGVATADQIAAIEANTNKEANIPTNLSIGNITEDSVGITSDGGVDDVVIPAATNTVAGVATASQIAAIEANTNKETNSPTSLSVGNITEDSVGITSDGSVDDVVIPAATNTVAGVATADHIQQIEANTAKNSLEVYVFENTTSTEINSTDIPIPLHLTNTEEGETEGNWTLIPGSTGDITAYADYSSTVAGAVLVTSAAHGLSTGDVLGISDTTDYNGIFDITVVDNDSFYIITTWNNDNGSSTWIIGDHAVIGEGIEGKYKLTANFTISEGGAAGSILKLFQYINTTRIDKTISEHRFSNNDVGSMSMQGILNLTIGDIIFITVQSSGSNNITLKNMNLILKRS